MEPILWRIARNLRIRTILFRDFFEPEWRFFDHLLTHGYTALYNLPAAVLRIAWDSFNDYQQSMRSHYRYKIIRRMKSFYAHGGRMDILEEPSAYADKLALLWRNVYDHAHEYRREVLGADFFRSVCEILPDNSSVLVARIQGQWAGFSLLLHDDTTLTQLFCGLDYALNSDYNVYFNMLYKVTEIGIQQGYQDIDFGITTMIPKLDIGADVVTLRMYMKNLNPSANRIVPWLFTAMAPHTRYAERHVFTS
ncbi:MAG: GNAT family N-acetyltransferase [Spartobacteria bacterium]|nr:GNAT family N-acetyltransferase [Spartobacteria bacterium]